MKTITMIGGPLDGMKVPKLGYFKEGDIEAVDTLEFAKPGCEWSPESVYVVHRGNLVYDPVLTKRRLKIVAEGGV